MVKRLDLLNFDAPVGNIVTCFTGLSGVLNVECKLLLFYSFILSFLNIEQPSVTTARLQ